MLKLFICLALLHFTGGVPLGKIFGGKLDSIKNYPFLVNLRRSGKFQCGGFLISPSCVLTAAHCLERRGNFVEDLTIHAQQQCLNDTSSEEHVRGALYATVHPNRYSFTSDKDIGVIKLDRSFDIGGNATYAKVEFNDFPAGSPLTIVGWGMTSLKEGFNPNQCLQVAKVQSLTEEKCRNTIGQVDTMTKNMFCAIGDDDTDTCSGDSGGPILLANRAVGIVSWGYGCGSGLPGVYTQLSAPEMSSYVKNILNRYC